MSQKSILEQALLQVQTLEEAVKQNAKGILASTMKQELNDLLKESEDEETKDSPEVAEQDVPEIGDEETPTDDEESDEMADEPESDEEGEEEVPADDEEMPADDEEMSSDDEMGDEDEMGTEDEEDVLDMTSASDEEVLKVFRAMKPDDGIVVKKEGDKISLNVDDEEYIIKLGDEGMGLNEDWNESEGQHDESMVDTSMLEDDDEELSEEDGTIFEIELDEEEAEVKESDETEEEPKEGEVKKGEHTEAARTQANDVRGEGPRQGKKFKAGRPELNEEVSTLRKQVQVLKEKNEEYKKALVLFKEKLNEVATFNANLAFATKLFTEHSTTKQEKMDILKRFDSVSTIKESKNLFTTIKSELDTKKPMTESVVEKITSTPTTSSTEVLSESKAYENPQFRRMKDLMSKIK